MLHLCCKQWGSWSRIFPSRIGYIVAKVAMNASQDHLRSGEFCPLRGLISDRAARFIASQLPTLVMAIPAKQKHNGNFPI